MKFRSKLFVTLVLLILIVMLGLGILLGQLFKSYYFNAFNNGIKHELNVLVNYIEENGGVEAFLEDKKALEIFSSFDTSLAILSPKQQILYHTYHYEDFSLAKHKAILKEIVNTSDHDGYQVVKGNFDYHYFWMPIKVKGEVEGFAVVSSQLAGMKQINFQMWWILFVSLSAALIIILIIGSRIATKYTKPIEAATNTAIELAKGNFRARTYEETGSVTAMLSTSINILARNLQEMETAREMQQDRLATLIENIGSGVLLIDSQGYITLFNKSYKQIFKIESHEFLYRLYYEVIPYKEVIRLIEDIFMTEKTVKKQFILPMKFERRHFEVYGAPIIGTNDEWKGIVLVFHDITEIKKLEQMRKDFVANVSHELKTPITSIKGFSETLLDGAMEDKETLEHFLTIILKESDRLQSLIQDLLDLSKIEQQGFLINFQKLDLINLLEETSLIFERKAEKKGIKFKVHPYPLPVIIEGDTLRLKQIFINLISNAIAYTPSRGEVGVFVREEEETVCVEVKDTGMGIQADELPRIFERFYRVDKARSRNSGGTGLGLAIVKHLLEAHKGDISVKSTPGKGTSFFVKLQKSILGNKG